MLKLTQQIREQWILMCAYDGIDPNAKMAVHTNDNPYAPKYRKLMSKLLKLRKDEHDKGISKTI